MGHERGGLVRVSAEWHMHGVPQAGPRPDVLAERVITVLLSGCHRHARLHLHLQPFGRSVITLT